MTGKKLLLKNNFSISDI